MGTARLGNVSVAVLSRKAPGIQTAVPTAEHVLWVQALPPGTLAQRTKLIALNEALKLEKEKMVYILTLDTPLPPHICMEPTYLERGLLTTEGKDMKSKD